MSQSPSTRGTPAATDTDCSEMRRCATSCYMRKWMSDRLKRRKKPGDGSSKEATKAPEPLQPRFYDDEPVAPVAVPGEVAAKAPAVESQRRSRPEPEAAPESASSASAAVEPKPSTS